MKDSLPVALDSAPLLSIVVPVRNRADIIGRTLDSIYAQSYRPISLIITDNASTDATLEVVAEWSAAHTSPDFSVTVVTESRPGASAARNRGLQEVATPYVMFFDSDDTMEFDHVERIAAHLKHHPETDILHWGISILLPDGWTIQKDSSSPDDLLSEHILHGTLSTQRFCVSTNTLLNVGGWNESLPVWNDYELGIRMLKNTPKTLHLPGPSRIHVLRWNESLTGPSFTSRADGLHTALAAIEKLLADSPRHLLILAARRAILAADYRREGSSELSGKMMAEALNGRSRKERTKLRLIYTVQRLVGHGGSALTPLLFPPDKKEGEKDKIG